MKCEVAALGRRTLRVDNSAVTNNFGYNSKSELTAAVVGTNAFGYNYDPIGSKKGDGPLWRGWGGEAVD